MLRNKAFPGLWLTLTIVCLATVAKVIWVFTVESYAAMDAFHYYEKALKIVAGSYTATDPFWPIGYSFFLSVLVRIFGEWLLPLKLANVALVVGISWNAYRIAATLINDKRVARLVVILISLYPDYYFYSNLLWGDLLFAFLLTQALSMQLRSTSLFSLAVASGVYALSFFVRPVGLFVPFIVLVCDGVRGCHVKKMVVSAAVMWAVIVAVHLPWSATVYQRTGKIVFVASNGAINLFIGNNPRATGTYCEGLDGLLEESGQTAGRYAVSYIVKHPWDTIFRIMPRKFYYLFFEDEMRLSGAEGLRTLAFSVLPQHLSREEYERVIRRSERTGYAEDVKKAYTVTENGADAKSGVGDYIRSCAANECLYAHVYRSENSKTRFLIEVMSAVVYFFIIGCLFLAFFMSVVNRCFRQAVKIPLFVTLYNIAVYLLFFGGTRYMIPIVPLIMVLVAYCLVSVRFETTEVGSEYKRRIE